MPQRTNVPCAGCSTPIDARRAAIASVRGLCVKCNAPTLRVNQAQNAPEYETAVWSRGGKL